ncbi:MerR family transcriptional regulator [Amycolatopsis methanolica]|uniref:MerR-family transcriptional regulator n=1 Tax=Amycolatopsis methanolica 239 TaxID=1068978 RepID=A0A076MUJ0_AMYME|nr:helix-turn-helix domain-containing protein [Amycolatopsis methanolica]AIJ24563.1 MerR-family transcriptional regulator [Amycolatopsis methanolica 239]
MQNPLVLAIGEFAKLTHLSIRTLRRYHDAGLLEPARVDPATGYRYYDAAQIPAAQVIHRLRELDVPLSEVRRILGSPAPEARALLVGEHLRRLEDQLERTRAAVTSLRRLLTPEPGELAVELRRTPATTVAAVGGPSRRRTCSPGTRARWPSWTRWWPTRPARPAACTATSCSPTAAAACWSTCRSPNHPRPPVGCGR